MDASVPHEAVVCPCLVITQDKYDVRIFCCFYATNEGEGESSGNTTDYSIHPRNGIQ
jgi:hypothetical protein